MASKDKNLGAGEVVLLKIREHAKALFWPFASVLVGIVVVVASLLLLPESWSPVGIYVIVGVVVILLIFSFVIPWLRWLTTTITITDRRIITRRGIINIKGHDLPLRRINNVNYDIDLVDRLFGCGTLILETAAESPLELHDIPKVEQVHVMITEMLFRDGPDGDNRGE